MAARLETSSERFLLLQISRNLQGAYDDSPGLTVFRATESAESETLLQPQAAQAGSNPK